MFPAMLKKQYSVPHGITTWKMQLPHINVSSSTNLFFTEHFTLNNNIIKYPVQ